MYGEVLAQALCRLKGDELRTIYVLGCDTAIHDLLIAKGADLFTRDAEKDRFTVNLQNKVEACRKRSDEELRLELLLTLAKICKMQGAYLTNERELADYLKQIADHTEAFLRQDDKSYRVFREAEPDAAPFDAMIRFQLDRVLNELGRKVSEGSPEEQEAYMRRLRGFMDTMPEEQQNELKQKLGVNELTDQVLLQTIAAGGTGLLLSLLVELSGFAFYTTATSLVASFAGLFGLTLPFGAYTMLTSAIAVLANPLFLAGLMVGGGAVMLKWQNGKLQRRLLPLLLLQIALPQLERQDPVDCAPLLELWKSHYENHARIRARIDAESAEIDRFDAELADLSLQKKQCAVREDLAKQQIAQIEKELGARIVNTIDGLSDLMPELCVWIKPYQANQASIREERLGRVRKQPGLMGLMKQAFNSTVSGVKVMEIERKQRSLEQDMTRAALCSSREWSLKERFALKAEEDILASCRFEQDRLDRQFLAASGGRSHANRRNADLQRELKELQKTVYGLEHL